MTRRDRTEEERQPPFLSPAHSEGGREGEETGLLNRREIAHAARIRLYTLLTRRISPCQTAMTYLTAQRTYTARHKERSVDPRTSIQMRPPTPRVEREGMWGIYIVSSQDRSASVRVGGRADFKQRRKHDSIYTRLLWCARRILRGLRQWLPFPAHLGGRKGNIRTHAQMARAECAAVCAHVCVLQAEQCTEMGDIFVLL